MYDPKNNLYLLGGENAKELRKKDYQVCVHQLALMVLADLEESIREITRNDRHHDGEPWGPDDLWDDTVFEAVEDLGIESDVTREVFKLLGRGPEED